MPGRTFSHSESRWAQLPPTIVRCNGTLHSGQRCRREAVDGSVVCDIHGGAAPQVRRRAAELLIMTADQAAQMLVRMMEDREVPFGVRAKIAQDLLDRAGLIATQVHQIVPTAEDPIMRFFEEAFGDPNNWVSTTQPNPTPAIESYAASSLDHHDIESEEILEAEIVADESGNDTPPRVAEMIKSGAFDRKVAMADLINISVLGLIHHNKSGSTDPLQVVMASKAFPAVARSVHTVIPDPDDETSNRRLFGTPKNNLGRTDLPMLSFVIDSFALEVDDGTASTGRLVWGAESKITIYEAMRRSAESPDEKSATVEAVEWLEDYLALNQGRAASAKIKINGASAGHSYDSLKRARRMIGSAVESSGFPRRTFWLHPKESRE
jgi:hypothetical protein